MVKCVVTEEPDFVIKGSLGNDRLEVFVYDDYIEFSAIVDNCSEIFKITKDKMKELMQNE